MENISSTKNIGTIKIKKSSILVPELKPLIKQGRLYYCETDKARTIIRLGKRIAEEFSDLQGKSPISYNLEYYRSNEDFIGRIREMIKKNSELPFLLFLEKEE
jgi:hypothetical protein